MLETLSRVPWGRLGHAYGSAADVPEWIRALGADDAEVRKKARHALYGNIFHQGTRYEASAYAVPFLLELLADRSTPERAGILHLLTSLAIGYDESWLPGPFPVGSYRQQAVGGERILHAAPLPSFEDDEAVFRYVESLDDHDRESMFAHIELSVYEAARDGVPLFCALLTDEEPRLRIGAAYALAWFGEDAAVSAGPLTSAVADPDAAVAATALVALGLTGSPENGGATESGGVPDRAVVRAALADSRELVRWGAAVALARLDGPGAGPAVAAELLAWTGGGRPGCREIPYLDGDLAGLAGLALRQLGDEHDEAAFEALLARIPSVDGPDALPVVGEALRRAFPAGRIGAGVEFADLDARQRRLLQALAGSPSTWQWGGFGMFANFMGMVNAYGLPKTAEAMRTFVSPP